MYIYLENDFFIPLNEIIAVVSIGEFLKSEIGEEFYKKNKNNLIDLSKSEKKTIIITDKFCYTTSYTAHTLYSRGCEFQKLRKKGVKIETKNTEVL